MMTLEHIIGVTLFFVLAVILLTCALVALVKHYGIVQQNEELREYVAFSETRRRRSMQYLLDTVCRHDQEFIDYAAAKQFGLIAPQPERERPPLRIHGYQTAETHNRTERTRPIRQPEPPPRERVVVVTEPQRKRPPPRNRLPFWGDDDDDVIDITPSAPNPHRAMPQAPIALLGAPRNRGGRPRKHSSNAAKQRDYNQRKKQS